MSILGNATLSDWESGDFIFWYCVYLSVGCNNILNVMVGQRLLVMFLVLGSLHFSICGQESNYEGIEILIDDTIIWKNDFHDLGYTLDSNRLVKLSFRPITDGAKEIYYLDGTLFAKGVIKKGKEKGFWQFRHRSGKLARMGKFKNGSAYGEHVFWQRDGKLTGFGILRNGTYSGKFYRFKIDDQDAVKEFYKKGVFVSRENLPPTLATRQQGRLLKKVEKHQIGRKLK